MIDSDFGLCFQWLPSPTLGAIQWNGLHSSLHFPPFWLLLLTLPLPRVVCQVVIESNFNHSYTKSRWILTRSPMDTPSPTSAVAQGKECVLLCTSRHFGFCCWRLLTYGYAARRLGNRPIHSPAVQSNLRTIFSLKFYNNNNSNNTNT